MLEQVDLDVSLSKDDYRRLLPKLQIRLYDLEHAAFVARIPVAVVFEGWAAAGKGSTINLLTERLDARGFRVVPVTPPRTADLHYPWLRRFWLTVPARGQMVMYDTSWYRRVLIERIEEQVKKHEYQLAYQDITEFEEQLAADGAVIVKFWFHISRKEQGRRFKRLLRDPLTAWQVTGEDARQHKDYDEYLVAVEEMLARTDMPYAPWTIVEATDKRHTRIKVFETLIRTLSDRLGVTATPSERSTTAGRNGAKVKAKPPAKAASGAKAKRAPAPPSRMRARTRRTGGKGGGRAR